MNTLKAFLVSLAILIALTAHTQTEYTPNCKKAINSIVALKFDEARVILQQEERLNPDNHMVVFLEDYIDFLKVFISEKENIYEKALERRKDRLNKLDAIPEKNPYKDYLKGEIYLRWATAKGKMGDRFSAALDLNKAYRLLKQNYIEFPDFIPGYAGLGAIEVLIGTIPDKYEWLAGLLNLEGTIKGGKSRIEQLLKLAENDDSLTFLEGPTLFMLSFIEMSTQHHVDHSIMKRYQEYDSAGTLANEPLLIFSYANLLQKKRKNELTIKILNYYKQDEAHYPFYYLNYMKGLTYLFKNSPKCLHYLNRYLEEFPGRHYIKSAYQKKAWYYLIKGDTVRYRHYMSQVAGHGYAVIGADKNAAGEAERGKIPNVVLLSARLAFDGGYYKNALRKLASFEKTGKSTREITEWYYRKGRVYHETDNSEKALKFYEKAYRKGKDLDAYFAANAALMAGRIYAQQNQQHKALIKYNQALELSGFDYAMSIHQKAEAGKSRLVEDDKQ